MRRDVALLEAGIFDLLIVGGGIHGAWVALRAAQAGYKVALIERDDFGAATSANSLKILHGGLRYLQHLDIARMRSSIRARREFARRWPRFVQPLPCVMPLHAGGARSPWIFGPALLANDVVSADRNLGVTASARLSHGRLLSADACLSHIAPLADVRPLAGGLWWDAVALDAARLTLEPLLLATHAGAVVANRVEALEYRSNDHAINGVTALDRQSGRTFDIRAAVVVDATGPGCQWLLGKLPVARRLPRAWLGGLNVVLRRSLGMEAAVALSSHTKAADRSAVLRRATRELFFVPWRGVTMIGTDYVPVRDPADAALPPTGAVAQFVEECARVAPRAGISMADVALVHWGLLPTDAPTAKLPGKSPLLLSGLHETGLDGLVVVVGEKLTSAPLLSQSVLQRVQQQLRRMPPAQQPDKSIDDVATESAELHPDVRTRLVARYGEQWLAVAGLGLEQSGWLAPIHASSEVRGVEIIHAIRNEMALTLDDLVLRRLGIGEPGHPGIEVLRSCAAIAAPEFGWNDADRDQAVMALDAWFEQRRFR